MPKIIFISLLLVLSACGFFNAANDNSDNGVNNAASAHAKNNTAIKTPQFRQSQLMPKHQRAQHEAVSENVMITSQGQSTTQAAVQMLEQGGNLFDAAAAMSFVISVERPHSTGLGGGGFMLMHEAATKKTLAYDFRETAPQAATRDMYLDATGKQKTKASRNGGLAVATPGLVAGILEIHQKHGKLSRAQMLQPAIELAEQGFEVYPELARAIQVRSALLKSQGGAHIFFNTSGDALKQGELLRQLELAQSLKRIADKGAAGFYQGQTAQAIINSVKAHGGLLSAEDLAQYTMKIRQPVWGSYEGYKIASMPPPSSGGVHIIQMLNILEDYQLKHQDFKAWGPQNAKTIHTVVSAMQLAYVDRARYLGDSDFQNIPVKALLSKKYAQSLSPLINTQQALKDNTLLAPRELPYESDDTTHFTLMDKDGNVISSTQTINGWFGSSLIAAGTGIILNNEMDDFASHVGGVNLYGAIGGKNNLVEPLKRPLSSMSPTLIFKANDEPYLALGTPSGTRIINCVMQTLLNRLEFDLPLYDAVHLTRYHHQWQPDEIRIGEPYFSQSVMDDLEKRGHTINKKGLGCKVQAVERTNTGLIGVSDNRGEGLAQGL